MNVLGEQTRGKNDNAVRAFVLSDLARAVLEQQRAVTGASESVFCLKKAKPITISAGRSIAG